MAPTGVAVTAEIDVAAPLRRTFETIVPIDLTQIMRGFGPLPAVRATREQTGAWDHAGASRVVELADGAELRERLTAYCPPVHFAYAISDIRGPLGLLVSGIDGGWWFSEGAPGSGAGAHAVDGGALGVDEGALGPGACTHVSWTYVFRPRLGRAAIVRAVIAPLWAVYQRRALSLAVQRVVVP